LSDLLLPAVDGVGELCDEGAMRGCDPSDAPGRSGSRAVGCDR
jgi:hypothetical protein